MSRPRKTLASEPFHVDPEAGCELTADQMVQKLWNVIEELKEDRDAESPMNFPWSGSGAHCTYVSPSGHYCGFHDHRGEMINGRWHCRWHKFVPNNDTVILTLTE